MRNGNTRASTVLIAGGAAAALLLAVGTTCSRSQEINDYPTAVRADYVFACMKANGETRRALEQCSCSIDVIASVIPYDRYVTAETVLSMSQVIGQSGNAVSLDGAGEDGGERPAPRAGGSRGALFLAAPSHRL